MKPTVGLSFISLGLYLLTGGAVGQPLLSDVPSRPPLVRCLAVPGPKTESPVLARGVQLGDERWLSPAQAVEAIEAAAGTPICVHWRLMGEAGADGDKPVLTSPCATTLAEALQDVFDQASKCGVTIHCETRDGVVHVVPQEFADRTLVIRVYDVQPLLDPLEAWQRAGEERHARHLQRLCTLCPPLKHWRNPGKLGMGKERFSCMGPYLEEPVAAYADAVSQLTDLIEQAVEPGGWRRNGGAGTCECVAGRLIVQQPQRVQDQVAAFLETLAASLVGQSGNAAMPRPAVSADAANRPPQDAP